MANREVLHISKGQMQENHHVTPPESRLLDFDKLIIKPTSTIIVITIWIGVVARWEGMNETKDTLDHHLSKKSIDSNNKSKLLSLEHILSCILY